MKIGFAGTPAFAAQCLQAMIEVAGLENSKLELVAVWSQPDRPAGRGRKLSASPVKALALEHGLMVHQPHDFKSDEARAQMQALKLDVLVVVAYGLILPQAVLDLPTKGCINVHASLLPAWRGAAPIQRALLAGDETTGICIMQMEAGLDTGPVLDRSSLDIKPKDTSQTLHDALAELGALRLTHVLKKMSAGEVLVAEPQDDELASYAKKITTQESWVDWHDSAENIERKIRGLQPHPACVTWLGDKRIKIHQASVCLDMASFVSASSQVPGEILAQQKTNFWWPQAPV